MTVSPDYNRGHSSPESIKEEADNARQQQSQTWEFVTPTQKKAEKEETDEDGSSGGSGNGDPPDPALFADIPKPSVTKSALKSIKKYPIPHPYMRYFRGVPMNELHETDKPSMNLPTDAQQLVAIHAERVGLIHVSDVRAMANEHGWIHVNQLPQQLIRHRAPAEGPDIPINPGTWHPVSEPEPQHYEAPPEIPDFSGLTPAQLAAMREGLRRAEARAKMVEQSEMRITDDRAADATIERVAAIEKSQNVRIQSDDDRDPWTIKNEARMISTRPVLSTPPPSRTPVVAEDAKNVKPDEQTVVRERLAKLFTEPDPASAPSTSGLTNEAKRRMEDLKRAAEAQNATQTDESDGEQ
jgi:hypothetical protein